MIEKLLKFYLSSTGKKYLLPFVDGLVNSGRPTEAFFPTELIEQGLSLAMSGLNNTMTLQGNLNWIWPVWYEQQRKADSPFFIPTGANMMTSNLCLRNWVSMGNLNSSKEFMVDPVGMLTPGPWMYSVFPFIRVDDVSYFPPSLFDCTEQSFLNTSSPILKTTYHLDIDLEWWSECEALQDNHVEVARFSHYIKNTSNYLRTIRFGISLRPYNCLTIGHINGIHFENKKWFINDTLSVLVNQDPQTVEVSNRFNGDPLNRMRLKPREPRHATKSGIASGVCEWEFELRPGEVHKLDTPVIYNHKSPREEQPTTAFTPAYITKMQSQSEQQWQKFSDAGMQISVPDSSIQRAFDHLKKHIGIFDDQTHFSPGTYVYHVFWIRDNYFLSNAFSRMGHFDAVYPKIATLLKHQTPSGFFKSQDGEWDSNGQALRCFTDYCRYTGDTSVIEKNKQALLRSVKWVKNARTPREPHFYRHAGMLPAGFSAEHFGPNDHYFWDNFWNLSGIEELDRLFQILGIHAPMVHDLGQEYRKDLERIIKQTVDMNNGVLPSSPYRYLDSSAIGNMVLAAPLDLYSCKTSWLINTVEYLMQHHLYEGMFFQQIIHTGMNAYLSTHLAHTLMLLNDTRWVEILHAILDHSNATYTWPEAINPSSGGGCMGDGDHGWATADILGLLRCIFVDEHNQRLLLGSGLLSHWFREDVTIRVENAPSLYGKVSYSIGLIHNQLEISWTIHKNALQGSAPAYLFVPDSIAHSFGIAKIEEFNRPGIIISELQGQKSLSKKTEPCLSKVQLS